MTRQERKSIAIAKALVKAIRAVEDFDGDPDMVLDDAEVFACRDKAVTAVVKTMRMHYSGELEQIGL